VRETIPGEKKSEKVLDLCERDVSIVGDGTYVDASVKSDQMQFISQHTNP